MLFKIKYIKKIGDWTRFNPGLIRGLLGMSPNYTENEFLGMGVGLGIASNSKWGWGYGPHPKLIPLASLDQVICLSYIYFNLHHIKNMPQLYVV